MYARMYVYTRACAPRSKTPRHPSDDQQPSTRRQHGKHLALSWCHAFGFFDSRPLFFRHAECVYRTIADAPCVCNQQKSIVKILEEVRRQTHSILFLPPENTKSLSAITATPGVDRGLGGTPVTPAVIF